MGEKIDTLEQEIRTELYVVLDSIANVLIANASETQITLNQINRFSPELAGIKSLIEKGIKEKAMLNKVTDMSGAPQFKSPEWKNIADSIHELMEELIEELQELINAKIQ